MISTPTVDYSQTSNNHVNFRFGYNTTLKERGSTRWQTKTTRRWGTEGGDGGQWELDYLLDLLLLLLFFILQLYCPFGVRPMGKIRVAFPGESQLRQSRATQPRVHAGSVSASIFHPALTRTTGSLTCAQILMHTIAHGVVGRPQQSALKVKGHRGEKSLAAPVNRTCVNSVPVRCSTNWTISLPCYLQSLSGKIEWS